MSRGPSFYQLLLSCQFLTKVECAISADRRWSQLTSAEICRAIISAAFDDISQRYSPVQPETTMSSQRQFADDYARKNCGLLSNAVEAAARAQVAWRKLREQDQERWNVKALRAREANQRKANKATTKNQQEAKAAKRQINSIHWWSS